jgi:hypothetical protein
LTKDITTKRVFIDFSLSRSTLTIYGISQDNDAKALSPGAIQVSWKEPEHNTQDIIGYVLHIRRSSGQDHTHAHVHSILLLL